MGEIEDRLERLAAHRAEQVPAFSISHGNEVDRGRVMRHSPAIGAIAACLALALVIGGALLFLNNDHASVRTPTGLPRGGAEAGCSGKAYVANNRDGTVSVIDTATGEVSDTIVVGAFPYGAALAPDGEQLYVTTGTAIALGDEPSKIVVTPDGHAYVPDTVGSVDVINTASGVVSDTITVGNIPSSATFTRDGRHAYVSNGGDSTVSVIDTAKGEVTKTITVASFPNSPTLTPDGKRAYVPLNDGTVAVIDTARGEVSDTITVGSTPVVLNITPDGKHAYVTNSGDDTVSVIQIATGAVSDTITVGKSPGGVAISPDGKHAYVGNRDDGTVSVIEIATGTVSHTITVGAHPLGITFTLDGKHAYVGNNGAGTVSVINTTTGVVSDTITVGNGPILAELCPVQSTQAR